MNIISRVCLALVALMVTEPCSLKAEELSTSGAPSASGRVLKAGSIFTPRRILVPASLIPLEFIYAPRRPWIVSRYALQTEIVTLDGWDLDTDIVFLPPRRFAPRSFGESFVFGGKISRSLSDTESIGAAIQASKNSFRFGGDLLLRPSSRFSVKAETYVARESSEACIGGYLLGTYRLSDHVSPHFQLDYQTSEEELLDMGRVFTVGFSFWTKNRLTQFVFDQQRTPNDETTQVRAMLERRF